MTAELKYDAAVQAVAGQGEGDMWHDLSVETANQAILGVSDDEPRRVWRAIDEQREGENYYSTTTRWRKLSGLLQEAVCSGRSWLHEFRGSMVVENQASC